MNDQILAKDKIIQQLWHVFDLFHGTPINITEIKNYVLGIFLLKFATDAWKEYSDSQQDTTRSNKVQPLIAIPEGIDFYSIQTRIEENNIGAIIDLALSELEKANPDILSGIFSNTRFERLSQFNNELKNLISIFSDINLSPSQFQNQNVISDVYNFLLEKFAEAEGKRGGEYFTPHNIVQLMVELLEPEPGMSVYDPAMGSAGFLVQASKWVAGHHKNEHQLELFGQEINLEAYSLARINQVINNISNASLFLGDTLLDPKTVIGDGHLQKFDRIISNPPFAVRLAPRTRELIEQDPYDRYLMGPITRIGDFAFIQHIIASLNDKGRAAVIVHARPLFATGAEGEIRKQIVESDLIEAVISLGPRLLSNTSIPIFILVINKAKYPKQEGKILFINAIEEYEQKDRNTYVIGNNQRKTIIEALNQNDEIDRFSSSTSLEDLRQNGFNLIPARYVNTVDVNNFLGGKVNWKTLSEIARITRGTQLGRSMRVEGNLPIIRVSDLANPNLEPDDLKKVAPPEDKRRIRFAKTGDILITRIGNTPKIHLVDEELNGIMVDHNLFIIRMKSEFLFMRQYIAEFFRSDKGQSLLSSLFIGAAMPYMRQNDIIALEIPIPEEAVIELISNIQQVETELFQRIDKAQLLRTELFNIEDPETVKTRLDELSTAAHILSSSLIQADSLDYQIRNFYPYPLAFAYRTLSAIHDPARKYPEQLRVAENLLVFLATIGLSLVYGLPDIDTLHIKVINISNIKKCFGGGISPGDWQSIAQASGKVLLNQREFAVVESFASLWVKGKSNRESDFAKATKELVKLKNDYKHDRGPKTPEDFKMASSSLQEILEVGYEQLSFFVKNPIRLIQNLDVEWQTNEAILDTLVYVGDHQGLRQERVFYPTTLPKGKLFIEIQKDNWIPLYPNISVQYCPSCKFRETYFIDRWDSKKVILKSFERGHTHENDDDATRVAKDADYWLKNTLEGSL